MAVPEPPAVPSAADRPGLRVPFVPGHAERDLDLRVPGGHTRFLQEPFDAYEPVSRLTVVG